MTIVPDQTRRNETLKRVLRETGVGIIAAIIVAGIGWLWNSLTNGDLVRLLGGMTKPEVEALIQTHIPPHAPTGLPSTSSLWKEERNPTIQSFDPTCEYRFHITGSSATNDLKSSEDYIGAYLYFTFESTNKLISQFHNHGIYSVVIDNPNGSGQIPTLSAAIWGDLAESGLGAKIGSFSGKLENRCSS